MGAIGGIIYSPFSSKEKVEKYQKIIRDFEWIDLKPHIKKGGS